MDTEAFSPVTFPCSGRAMANRLVKVALYEHLGRIYGGPPNKYHMGLYAEWAKYDWGMIITGNIQVSREHLSLGRDIVVPEVLSKDTLAPFEELARTIHAGGLREPSTRPLALMQLSHAGRQSPNFIGGRRLGVPPLAPSPVRLGSNKRRWSCDGAMSLDPQGGLHPYFHVLFQQPLEMTVHDIKQVQQAFIKGALTALKAGFDGIQLHCAHGYLLAQFLNPKTNVRRDEYSVESPDALRMVREIVEGIRAIVPKEFIVGVKINSADYVGTGEEPSSERELGQTRYVLDHVRKVALWGMVDFIEISGGDYESPDFMATKEMSPRQAMFAQFAKEARECLKTGFPAGVHVPLILLTGGLRSPSHIQSALDAGHADLLGIGRGSILHPDLPAIMQKRMFNAAARGTSIILDDEPFAHDPCGDIWLPSWVPQIPLVGAGVGLAWHNVRMRRIATIGFKERMDGKSLRVVLLTGGMGGIEVLVRMWVWLDWHEILMGASLICCVVASVLCR